AGVSVAPGCRGRARAQSRQAGISLTRLETRPYTRTTRRVASAAIGVGETMLVEMVVESVRVNLQTYQRVVVLKEKGSDRYLPIWIGNNEADAIVIQLQSVPVHRPQTHDLLKSVLTERRSKVTCIICN